MKFKILGTGILIFLIFNSTPTIQNVKAETNTIEDNQEEILSNKNGLGYSINAAKNRYLDVSEIRTGSPIFHENFLNDALNHTIKSNVFSSNTYSVSDNSIENIIKNITLKLGFSRDVTANGKIFQANIKDGFETTANMNYSNTQSHYFYNLRAEFIDYTYTLPNYSSDLSKYIEHLHPNFKSDLSKWSLRRLSSFELFDKYGTHVIMKGKYGGTLDFYYSVTSNNLDVGGNLKLKIDNALNVGIANVIGTSSDFHFNLEDAIEKNISKCNTQLKINTYGGNFFSATSLEGFNENYDNWYASISSKPTLIGTTSDGLVPIWMFEINPLKQQLLKEEYVRYLNEHGIDKNDYLSPNFENQEYKDTLNLRLSERTITDDGRFVHDIHDAIDLDNDLTYGIEIMNKNNFKSILVTFSAEMKEINHGYQYVFIYKSKQNNQNHLLHNQTYELNGNSLQKNYVTKSFSVEFGLNEFLDTHLLVFRYGASGSQDDDWKNKNINITITFKK